MRILCAAVLLVVLALGAGCGGDDGASPADEGPSTPNHGLDAEFVFTSAELGEDTGVIWESTRTADQACTWVGDTVSNCLDIAQADETGLTWSVGASAGYSALIGLAPTETEVVELDFGGDQIRTLPLDAEADGTQAFGWAMAYADADSIPVTLRALGPAGDAIDSVEIDLVSRT